MNALHQFTSALAALAFEIRLMARGISYRRYGLTISIVSVFQRP